MLKRIVQFIFLAFSFIFSYSQEQLPPVYLNHIYIVVDSGTYAHLFDSSVITRQITYPLEISTQTTENSYTGKYIAGKMSYFEFFSTRGHPGVSVGDIGLGFMTFKSGDIQKIKQQWKNNKQDSVSFRTIEAIDKNKSRPWYFDLELWRKDSLNAVSTWLMENSPEDLVINGFTKQEIKNNVITWQDYVERQNKTKLRKPFERISSVTLSVNKEQFEYLQKSLTGIGLKQNGKVFSNKNITVQCEIDSSNPNHIEQVETILSKNFPDGEVRVGKKIIVRIKANKSTWIFR